MTRARVFVTAPAKVNFCLHAGRKRADGYHNIQSLVAFAALEDALLIEPADEFSLTILGAFKEEVPSGEENLVVRAARQLAKKSSCSRGARITLKKMIPAASGLGGGSADAAAALRGLACLWDLDYGVDHLREVASSIGADVPVCVESAPAWMEGKGERVRRIPQFPSAWLLLVNPRVPVPTAAAFANVQERSGLPLSCPAAPFADVHSLVDYLRSTSNDLEKPATEIAPVIEEVLNELNQLPGVLFARMSGSGATCYGIFASHGCSSAPEMTLKKKHPDWFIRGSSLASEGAGKPVLVQ